MEAIIVAVITAMGVVGAAWFTARAMIRIGAETERTEHETERVDSIEAAYEQVIETLREELTLTREQLRKERES